MRLQELEFAELRERLYPLLMDPAQIQEKGQGQMVNGALAEGLVVIYCIEESEAKIRYITYQDLRDWGVSHTTVHVTAIRNLERRTDGQRVTRLNSPNGGRPMYIWHLEDGFDAARILLPKWLDDFAAEVPGDLIIGVPHRNWLVAIGNAEPDLVRVVRSRVQDEYRGAGFPVSPHLYRWTGNQLERYRAQENVAHGQ